MDIVNINSVDVHVFNLYINSIGSTILMYLVDKTHKHPEYIDHIKYILDNNPEELDKQDNLGFTALMIACKNTDSTSTLDTVKLLLKYNPDLYLENNFNCSALYCIFKRHPVSIFYKQTIQLLLDHGLDINRPGTNGRHIIEDIVCFSFSHDILKYILTSTNIDMYYKNKDNKYVYEYLLRTGNSEIIELTKNLMDNSLDVKYALD